MVWEPHPGELGVRREGVALGELPRPRPCLMTPRPGGGEVSCPKMGGPGERIWWPLGCSSAPQGSQASRAQDGHLAMALGRGLVASPAGVTHGAQPPPQ